MPSVRIFRSNDSYESGIGGYAKHTVILRDMLPGPVTANSVDRPLWVVPKKFKGRVVDCVASVLATGADGSNPLHSTFTPKKNNTNLCTTNANIDKTAAANNIATTVNPGTGITQAALKKDATIEFQPGDVIHWDYTIQRTATPSSEIKGPAICLILEVYAE